MIRSVMTIKIVSKNIKISNKIIFFEDLLVYRRLKIMVLIIGLFLFVNLLLLIINIICFCNKSRYFIYSMFINNIISVTTLLMCINYIKELMLKSDWTALLDIVPVIVPILTIYFIGVCMIQMILMILFYKKWVICQ